MKIKCKVQSHTEKQDKTALKNEKPCKIQRQRKKKKIYVQHMYLGDGRSLVVLKECSEGGQHLDVSL